MVLGYQSQDPSRRAPHANLQLSEVRVDEVSRRFFNSFPALFKRNMRVKAAIAICVVGEDVKLQ
jgi:hypothetical protein